MRDKSFFILNVITLAFLLGGCVDEYADDLFGNGNESSNSNQASTVTVSGSVGDGPVVGASVAYFDSDGNQIAQSISNSHARHTVDLPADAKFPVILTVTGGTDVVTGRAPDFVFRSIVVTPGFTTVNLNPYSTLIVGIAEKLPGGVTQENIDSARYSVLDQLNFGINSSNFEDPITSEINTANAASVIKATEVLGELFRRIELEVKASGEQTDIEAVIDAIAADLVDGILDGRGGPGASTRIAVTAHVIGAQLAFESLSNSIHVDGLNIMNVLDVAIQTVMPDVVGSELARGVPVSAAAVKHATNMMRTAENFSSSPVLAEIEGTIDSFSDGVLAFDTEIALLNNDRSEFDEAIRMLRDSTPERIYAACVFLRNQRTTTPAHGVLALHERPRKDQHWLFSGGQVRVQWRDIELSDGSFDFTILDEKLAAIAEANVPVTVQVNANLHPQYLFDQVPYHLVPMHVQVKDDQGTLMYWHPRYADAHRRMLSKLAEYIRSSRYRNYILGVRQNFNAIGTELSIVDPEYVDESQWIMPPGVESAGEWDKRKLQLYLQQVLAWYSKYFDPDIRIFGRALMFANSLAFTSNPGHSYYAADQLLLKGFQEKMSSGAWSLMRTSSEMEPASNRWSQDSDRILMEYCRSGQTTCFTESRGSSTTASIERQFNPLPASAPQWNYWRILHDLHVGSTYIAVYREEWDQYSDEEYHSSFEFTARYAGYRIAPGFSDGAWVAFREGNYLRGDYNFLMRRLDIDSSVGLNNVGPVNQRYGYWARKLDAGDTMYFAVDPRFIVGIETSNVSIRITYLDDDGSSFTVSGGGQQKTVQGIGSGRWETAEINIDGGGVIADDNGAHIRISTDTGIILHMVELRRSSVE